MQLDPLKFFVVSFIVFLIGLVTLQRRCWRFVWQLNGIRGVLQQPILWALLCLYVEPKRIMQLTCRWRCFFTRPLAIIVGRRILLYIDDPYSIEQVFNSPECLNKTFLQDGFFARKGLLHATGQQWRTRRKQLNPAFSHSILLSFVSIFNSVGNQLQHIFHEKFQAQDTTNKYIDCSYEDVEDLLSRAVLEVSCLTMLGTATNFTAKDADGIASAYKKLLEISALRIMKPWLQWDKLFRFLERKAYENFTKSNKLVEQFVCDIVQRKHKAWLAENGQTKAKKSAENAESSSGVQGNNGGSGDGIIDVNNGNCARRACYADASEAYSNVGGETMRKRIFVEQIFHLATLGELTLEDILNETHAMILVSFETVSNSLLIALLLLAMHPECQQKLRKEITSTLKTHCSSFDGLVDDDEERGANAADAALNVMQLQEMKYLDMVVNESLRLLTTVPVNLRHVSNNFWLRLDASNRDVNKAPISVCVPPETVIVVDAFNMQRDVSCWGSASLKFEPEKHFASTPQTRHSYAFIPFSRGLRTCIGKSYSLLLMKIFLVKLIASFEFRTETQMSELRFIQGISLKLHCADGIKFRIRPLDVVGIELSDNSKNKSTDI